MTATAAPPWSVLLIGGSSGTGKTLASEFIARRFGIPWLQVDDFRLALQQATTAEQLPDLHYFLQAPAVRDAPAEELVDRLAAVGRIVSAALVDVVRHHVGANLPIVLEGDGLDPATVAGPGFKALEPLGIVRCVFLVEPDEGQIRAALEARPDRAAVEHSEHVAVQARVAWLHGQWLQREARGRALPVVAARPYDRLAARLEKELT